MANNNLKEKPLTIKDLPSSQHPDPQTFIIELHRNLILSINQNKLLYLITGFKQKPEKIFVLGRSFLLKNNGYPEFDDIENNIPNIRVNFTGNGYVAYSNHEKEILVVGHAGDGKFVHLPIISRRR